MIILPIPNYVKIKDLVRIYIYTRHIIHITNPNPAREIIFFYDIIVIFSVSYILLVIEKSYPSNRNFLR